jgi:type IV fimbrial biogenesis protein FimT
LLKSNFDFHSQFATMFLMVNVSKSRNLGFTLLEIMVAVVIVSILLGLAAPSFQDITQRYRALREINALGSDLQLARSQAVKEGQSVTVCASSNGTSCLGADTWEQGWIVFSDINSNQVADAGDTLVRVQGSLGGTNSLRPTNSVVSITFNREGFAVGLPVNVITFTLHTDPINNSATKCIALNRVGKQESQVTGVGACT